MLLRAENRRLRRLLYFVIGCGLLFFSVGLSHLHDYSLTIAVGDSNVGLDNWKLGTTVIVEVMVKNEADLAERSRLVDRSKQTTVLDMGDNSPFIEKEYTRLDREANTVSSIIRGSKSEKKEPTETSTDIIHINSDNVRAKGANDHVSNQSLSNSTARNDSATWPFVKLQSVREMAGVVLETIQQLVPEDYFAQNESYFRLRSSLVTKVAPLWLVQPSSCPPRGDLGSKKLLLVVVPSVGSHGDERGAIRNTWARPAYRDDLLSAHDQKASEIDPTVHQRDSAHNSTGMPMSTAQPLLQTKLLTYAESKTVVKVVFFLGMQDQNEVQKSILQESEKFRDIALADFRDSYANLSLKMATILQWVNDTCPSADYVIKVDQDTLVNVALLWALLHRLDASPWARAPFLLGHRHMNAYPPAPRHGPWAVDPRSYPMHSFPRYVYGHSYVISGQAIPLLRHASQHMPLVANEDAYVTGVLAKAGGVTRLTTGRMANVWTTKDDCLLATNEVVTQTGHGNAAHIYRKWAVVTSTWRTGRCYYKITEH